MSKKGVALEAIRSVHADTRQTLEQTKDDLEELRDACDELIDAVAADIEMQSE